MAGAPNLLPDSRLKRPLHVVSGHGITWQPIFCANCGTPGGRVPEEHCDFAFWLCNACYETHGKIAGAMVTPDEVFWQKVRDAQLEQHHRELTPLELVRELDDLDSPLSKLARDRA